MTNEITFKQTPGRHAVLCGLVYGELVFLFMYLVVLPLSALGPAHFSIAIYITGPIGHTFLVELPIALSVRRFAGATGDPTGASMDSTL